MGRKKLSKTMILYIFTAIFVSVLSVISFTLAWYVKTKTYTIGIVFAKPVLVSIDSSSTVNEVVSDDLSALKPGSRIGINVGFRLGGSGAKESSAAYVRAKISIVFDDVYNSDNSKVIWDPRLASNEYVTINEDFGGNWKLQDFSNDESIKDEWYVCVVANNNNVAREVQNNTVLPFYSGYINLSTKLDNRFAEKRVNVVFTVDAIQVEGVENPLISPKTGIWGSNL